MFFICSIIQVVGCLSIFDFNINPLYLINTDYRKINKFIVVNFIKITYKLRLNGRLAQLVEHLVYTENVGGSRPSPPTIFYYKPIQSLIIYIRQIIDYFNMKFYFPFGDTTCRIFLNLFV